LSIYQAVKKALDTIFPKQVLQHNDGTLIVYNMFFERVVKGYGFYTSKRFEDVGA